MTFKETVPLLQGREGDVGLIVVQAVLENRIENKVPYKAGRVQQFLNSERKRVLKGLERLAEGTATVPTPEGIAKQYGDSRLNKHRDIERVKYLYDGLKFRYQMLKGASTDAQRIVTIAELAQDVICSIAADSEDTTGDAGRAYRLAKESDREEYVRVLERIQRRLTRLTGGIVFYDPR